MANMEYLKDMPIAVLGGGAVGKSCAADMKLAGKEVRLYDMMPFAKNTLANLEKTGILLDGVQRNLYCFERSGRAYLDMVSSDMGKVVKGAGLIVIAAPAMAHEPFFRELIPHLEDGQVIHIFTDNYGTLLLRKMMREMGCTKQVIVGGWSSAPYGTRIESVGKFTFPHVGVKYRAITLRGASLPMSDIDAFMESSRYLPCIDAVTYGNGPEAGNTVLDTGFAYINPVIHVAATILGVSTMENWGVIFGGYDKNSYSMYCHGLCPSICEVQYQFFEEEKALAKEIGVGTPQYAYESFFSRRSVLTQEYMGLDNLTEDVPVGCKIYHDLGVQYGVPTPVIDSMIVLAGSMHKKSFFETSKYNLAYLGIDNMPKEELLSYLNEGIYNR